MAQEQNYQVNYSINVDASQGTKQVIAFGEAVGKLVQAKASLTPAVTNIKNMMDEIDRVFRTKNGKKRNFDYRLTIDTKKSEEKLERIKGLPNVKEHNVFKLTDYKEAYDKADIVVFLTAHTPFKELPWKDDKVILDFCGIFKQ